MSWIVAWSGLAEQDLLEIPWRLAMRVDAAIMAFAAGRSYEGSLERMTATDPYRLRLRFAWSNGITLG